MATKRHTYLFYGGIAAAFLLSRVWAYGAGVRFSHSILNWGWQILDLEQLKTNLAESIWYLHAQPPLYNLLIGFVLKIAHGHEAVVFQYLYLALGLGVALLLAATLRRLGVTALWAFLLTLLFCCSPAAILYENWALYTQLELFWTVWMIWAAVRVFTGGSKTRDLLLLFTGMACLCLTRSLYHWVLFAGVWGWVWYASAYKKRVLATGVLPFLVVMAWYFKTWLLFGSFSASTWFGMNVARLSHNPDTELGKIGLWQSPAMYDSLLHFGPSPYSAPVVADSVKQNGNWNMNCYGYIPVAKQFGKEAFEAFKHNPTPYMDNVGKAFLIYFEPPARHRFGFLEPNYTQLGALNRCYNLGYHYPEGQIGSNQAWVNIGVYLFVFLLAWFLPVWYGTHSPWRNTIVLLTLFVLYITLAGNLFEIYENNRFRFVTLPALVLLVGIEIRALQLLIKKRRKPAHAGQPEA